MTPLDRAELCRHCKGTGLMRHRRKRLPGGGVRHVYTTCDQCDGAGHATGPDLVRALIEQFPALEETLAPLLVEDDLFCDDAS